MMMLKLVFLVKMQFFAKIFLFQVYTRYIIVLKIVFLPELFEFVARKDRSHTDSKPVRRLITKPTAFMSNIDWILLEHLLIMTTAFELRLT